MMQPRKSCFCVVALVIALMFAACARPAGPPARLGLNLPPDALGAAIAVQQHLTVEREGRIVTLDVALEVDEQRIDLVGLALGRRILSLSYDGRTLTTWRDPVVPSQLRGEDVLEDLQLTLWPAARISEVLPKGWRIEENGRRRILLLDDSPVMVIDYSGEPRWSGEVVLRNMRYQYKLTIITALQHASQ
jgi:hypothetical protein